MRKLIFTVLAAAAILSVNSIGRTANAAPVPRFRVPRETSRRSRKPRAEDTAVGADRAMSEPAAHTAAGAVLAFKILSLRINGGRRIKAASFIISDPDTSS